MPLGLQCARRQGRSGPSTRFQCDAAFSSNSWDVQKEGVLLSGERKGVGFTRSGPPRNRSKGTAQPRSTRVRGDPLLLLHEYDGVKGILGGRGSRYSRR